MIMKQKGAIRSVILMLDIFCVIITYFLAAYIREGILQKSFFQSLYGIALFVVLLSNVAVFFFTEDSEQVFFKRGLLTEFFCVIQEQINVGLILLLFLFVTQQGIHYSRFFFLIFFILNMLIIYVVRCYFKLIMLTIYRNSSYSSQVMLITTKQLAAKTIHQMYAENMWNAKVAALCIVDEDMIGEKIGGIEVTANIKNIYEDVKLGAVDEVFINIPVRISLKVEKLILAFEKMGIVVHLNLDIYPELNLDQKRVGRFGSFQVVSFATNLFNRRQMMLKRFMDILGASVGLLFTCVIAVILGPLIYLESPGPIFFTQIRVGKNGRRFKIYKFRSMCIDAEERKADLLEKNEIQGHMFKIEKDPRITKIGKFIRKTSLDEFPQFLNVLRGDMSLVGTRPPTMDEFEQYEPEYKRRISIRPGLTGLWQVSGRSNITKFEEVVNLDLQYIDSWSLGQDLKIIFKTIVVILFGKGAK